MDLPLGFVERIRFFCEVSIFLYKRVIIVGFGGLVKAVVSDQNMTIGEKAGTISMMTYAKVVSRIKNLVNPYKSAKRERIWSSV